MGVLNPLSLYIGSGRKRALLIGINYFNTPNQLDGMKLDWMNE